MKLLMTLFITLNIFAGVGDSAGGSSKTWQELYRLDGITYDLNMPKYKFDDGMTFPAHKICLEGNTVRSITKVQKYKSVFVGIKHDRTEYVKDVFDYSRRPIEVSSEDRMRNDVELVHDIEVRRLVRRGNNRMGFRFDQGKLLFVKRLEIKNCEEYDN